ncbi:MAG: MMPL family transporter [Polyangiaceae bacterium]|nr:MMPL family transporter [Polyangiaceae bacterium]
MEYGVHLFKRYHEERGHGRDPEEATVRMLRSTGGAARRVPRQRLGLRGRRRGRLPRVHGVRADRVRRHGADDARDSAALPGAQLPGRPPLARARRPRQPMRPIAIPAWGRWATVVLVPVLAACSVWALSGVA